MYKLLYQLASGTWEDRKQACEALGQTGDAVAVKPLLQAAEDPDVLVREAACMALGELGEKEAATAISQLIPREPEPRVRIAAIHALAQLQNPEAVNVLIDLLSDHDHAIRLAACKALGPAGNPSALPALLDAIKDKNLHVRAAACQSLGLIKHPHAIRPLIECLGDTQPSVRNHALEALHYLGEERLVQAYTQALHAEPLSPGPMQTLVKSGDVRLISALINRLEDAWLSDAQRTTLFELFTFLQDAEKDILPLLYCTRHLSRFGKHPFLFNKRTRFSYPACRICKSTFHVLKVVSAIAVIDQNMKSKLHYTNKTLRINWLANRQLFDFDHVEIGRVEDKTVTQFCMLIGNDMDSQRVERYTNMACTLTAGAALHTNTLNILNKTFSQVRHVS